MIRIYVEIRHSTKFYEVEVKEAYLSSIDSERRDSYILTFLVSIVIEAIILKIEWTFLASITIPTLFLHTAHCATQSFKTFFQNSTAKFVWNAYKP